MNGPPSPDEARSFVQQPDGESLAEIFGAGFGGRLEGAEHLEAVCKCLTKYVIFPSAEAVDATALFVAATHCQDETEHAPRLIINSPCPQCGKSRLLSILAQLVARPLLTISISAAALVRSIDTPRTILFDEFDTIFGKGARGGDERTEALRGILNGGFDRDWPYSRYNASTRLVEDFPSFSMAVLSGIGRFPETIEQRAVTVSLRRKGPNEAVAKFRTRMDKPRVKWLGEQLNMWISPNAAQIGKAYPDMPSGLSDRQEDVWESLLAVADLAGGTWPDRARRAAQVLSAEAEDNAADISMSLQLLADLRDIFAQQDGDVMSSSAIVGTLGGIAESPWNSCNFGKPLTQRDLAKMLRGYGVRSKTVRVGASTPKGYELRDFGDVFMRYLPGRSAATSATAQHSQVRGVADAKQTPQQTQLLPMEAQQRNSQQPSNQARCGVADVADTLPETAIGLNGNCVNCGRECRRYGRGGRPLCTECNQHAGRQRGAAFK